MPSPGVNCPRSRSHAIAALAAILCALFGYASRAQQLPGDAAHGDAAAAAQEDPNRWRPATRPAGSLHASIATAFAALNDADPAARENARLQLMDLAVQDRASLEKVVRESLPLAPAQANALKEIVCHSAAAVGGYRVTTQDGFLGVKLGEVIIATPPPGEQEPAAQALDASELPRNGRGYSGVVIVERMPGFVGARMFHDGDIIIGLDMPPRHVPVRTAGELKGYVQLFGPGQTAKFVIMRQGQILVVPVTLDPKPDAADPMSGRGNMQDLIDTRRRDAEVYWQEVFWPMLKDVLG